MYWNGNITDFILHDKEKSLYKNCSDKATKKKNPGQPAVTNEYGYRNFLAGVQLQQPGIQHEGMSGVNEKLRQPLSFLGLTIYFKLIFSFILL